MSLQDKLDEYKASFVKKAPQDALDLMHKATHDLRESGILERALKKGDKAPHFELQNSAGKIIRSEDILTQHFMILTFYRGRW